MSSILLDPKTLIKNASDNIDNNISILCPNHIGLCAQNILSQSRNLIDALVIYKHRLDCPYYIPNSGNDALEKAYTHINHCNKIFKPLITFHHQLEIIASHYTQNLFDSESLLFRYSDTLYEIKRIADAEFGIQILKNLDDFPFSFSDVDYYEKIKAELDKTQNEAEFSYNTYYIEKKIRRPFDIFEYVLSPANDKTTKFDRLTVFSFENIHSRNAIQCAINKHKIIHNEIPIIINSISTWSYSIRPCELNKLSRIVGSETGIKRTTNGYKLLMSELTKDNISLFDFVNSNNFDDSLSSFQLKPTNKIYLFLTKIKRTIEKCEIGRNTIRYLLYICRHNIIKNQLAHDDNCFGNTHLKSGCYPFDSHPFSFSLIKHNPRLEDLLDCLYDCCTNDELLKRSLVVNTENKKKLYTPVKELDKYFLTKELADVFNKKLDERKKESSICFYNDFAYIQSYENHTISILNKLLEKSESGDESYLDKAKDYIKTIKQDDIDECKLNILKQAFNDSSVVLINGAAGTGKTTLIKHFSNIFKNEKVLFLSCTNSSVQNLKIRVGKASGRDKKDFMTIESFLQKSQSHGFSRYSILVVDECSMVENDAFDKILCTHNFEKMLLVGDEKQIESIRFGNWFGIANKFLKYCF